MRRSRVEALLTGLVVFLVVSAWCQGQVDKRAHQFSRLLKPASFGKGSPNDINGLKGQVIRLMEELQKNERTNKSAPDSLLSKAFSFKIDQIGRTQAMHTSGVLLRNWEEAAAMGLFDENDKFSDTIRQGRGSGSKAVFEYIVPPEVAPEFTKYIGNVRIVAPDRARPGNAPLTGREEAFLKQLQTVKQESETRQRMLDREKSKAAMPKKDLNRLGLTKAQEKARFDAEVAAAGSEAMNREPSVRIRGKVAAQPSHMSKNRYRVDFQVTNASNHPTEVLIEYYVLGITDRLNKIYIMEKRTEKTLLRAGQVNLVEVWTRNVGSFTKKAHLLDEKKSNKVRYKGFIAIAKFKGDKVVGLAASDARLMSYATGERAGLGTFPRF